MALLAHFEPLQQAGGDRRDAPRRKLALGTELGSFGPEVVIHDLSSKGLLLETSADLSSGETIEVQLPEMGPAQAIVIWSNGRLFGCAFKHVIPSAAVSAALLRGQIVPLPERPSHAQSAPDRQIPVPPSDPERETSEEWYGIDTKGRSIAPRIAAAIVLLGLTYVVLTGAVAPIVMIGVLGVLLSLLVAGGLWTINNTPL